MGAVFEIVVALMVGLATHGQTSGWHQYSLAALQVAPSGRKTESSSSYVGDPACQSCHKETVQTFHQTAHYLTSRLPEKDSILGTFAPPSNVMKTSNPDLSFRMDQKGDEFFQTAIQGEDPLTTTRSERFAFVIGSGGKGQTYLFWKGDDLFQLPVSYWTQLGWVNSPGYRDGVANFNRPVIPRCLECHATYFESVPPPPNRYRKTGFIVGITCEKCHGPGRDHVQHFAAKSAIDTAILNPARFSRDRQMDLCAWCHAGAGVSLQPAFSYVPGEAIQKYLGIDAPDPNAPVDVHGSQVELLEKSRCFQKSTMTCLTCHDVHVVQRDLDEFSQRCVSCHKAGTAMFPKQAHLATSNCIDCHMPLQETNLIVFDQNGKREKPRVRNHWIKIYTGTASPTSH
jgi:hypothetical protein